MADFHYKAFKGLTGLKRGQHVAWKHVSSTGQGFYHHAIVEEPAKNGQFVNIITRSVDGINRAVMSSDEGLHEVTIESTPKILDKDWQSRSKWGRFGEVFNKIKSPFSHQQPTAVEYTNQDQKEEQTDVYEATETSTMEMSDAQNIDPSSNFREEVYYRAVSALDTKEHWYVIGKSCEDFAYYCVTGTPREHDCPCCKTTAPPKMTL